MNIHTSHIHVKMRELQACGSSRMGPPCKGFRSPFPMQQDHSISVLCSLFCTCDQMGPFLLGACFRDGIVCKLLRAWHALAQVHTQVPSAQVFSPRFFQGTRLHLSDLCLSSEIISLIYLLSNSCSNALPNVNPVASSSGLCCLQLSLAVM